MAIPESQLRTWSNQGATITSASTYESIRNCINGGNWESGIGKTTYLQGSYKNTTNIYGDSDVDVISELTSVYSYDNSNLDEIGQASFNRSFSLATYSLAAYKKEVIQRLENCYGAHNVRVGKSAIKVLGNNSRLDADVVVCNSYRKYKKNNGSSSINFTKGIVFYEEGSGKKVINYPTPHYDNGVEKNQYSRTQNNLKKVTRIFKNLKSRMVKSGVMASSVSPSYFVECLIYNAKNEHFRKSNFTDMVVPIINQFSNDDKTDDNSKYVCQNYQRWLFGPGDQQWNKQDARTYVNNLIHAWNNWPS